MAERIIFYPEITAFGGGERVLLALSRHLHHQGLTHRLAFYYLSIDLRSHADWALPIFEMRPHRNPFLKAHALRSYLARQRADQMGKVLLVGIQAALHAGIFQPRDYTLMILDTPSLSEEPEASGYFNGISRAVRKRASKSLVRRGIRSANTVIATSQYMADEVKLLYGRDSLIVRQGGLPPDPCLKEAPLQRKTCLRMLSVSRLEKNKRIDWILQALPRLRINDVGANGNAWHLDIVGSGSQQDILIAQADRTGILQNVTFHGQVSDEQLHKLYAAASLFLMPAWQGYGLPALEALSRRLPVVMHQESGVSEILRGTPWVELIDGKVESLVLGMNRMIHRLRSGELEKQPLPIFPSESEWAKQICQICGWC